MVQNLPPDGEEARKKWREQMLLQHHADIQRLQKRGTQFPQQFFGAAQAHEVDAFNTTTSSTSS